MDRRSSGADGGLCTLFCQRAAGLGRKPQDPARRKSRGADAAAQHLQARHDQQHGTRLLVDGWWSGDVLFDQRDVRDPPAEGPRSQPCPDRDADYLRQRCRVPRKHVLGLGRRPYWPALGDDHPWPLGHTRSVLLYVEHRLLGHRDRLYRSGRVARRRCRRAGTIVYERAVSDRGAGDRGGVLLSHRDDTGRTGATGRHLFRFDLRSGVLDPDADRLRDRRRQLVLGTVPWSGDQREGNGPGSGSGLTRKSAGSEELPTAASPGPAKGRGFNSVAFRLAPSAQELPMAARGTQRPQPTGSSRPAIYPELSSRREDSHRRPLPDPYLT